MSEAARPRPRPRPLAVAAFDVDGTLTTGDCVVPFLRRLAGTRGIVGAVVRRPIATAASLVTLDRDRLKETVVGTVYRGRRVIDVEEAGREFAALAHATKLRADMLARLRWHQRQGHRTVLVSASLAAYLRPLAQTLEIDDVICTDVVDLDGVYTDLLAGGNCRGPEKWRRLERWLEERDLAGLALWAYGDSKGDRAMLDAATHPVWVADATVLAVPTGFER